MLDNIWNTIRVVNEVNAVVDLNQLESTLQKQIQHRYSGISGIIVSIYDWIVGNNNIINKAIICIKERKIKTYSFNVNKLENRIQDLSAKHLASENDFQKRIQSKEKIIEDLVKKNALLDSQLEKNSKELLNKNKHIKDLERLICKEKELPPTLDFLQKIRHLLGCVKDPSELGEFDITRWQDKFALSIQLPYSKSIDTTIENVRRTFISSDIFVLENIKTNIKLILENYKICSNRDTPKSGKFFCFNENTLLLCENGVRYTEPNIDLTKPVTIKELEKLYSSQLEPYKQNVRVHGGGGG